MIQINFNFNVKMLGTANHINSASTSAAMASLVTRKETITLEGGNYHGYYLIGYLINFNFNIIQINIIVMIGYIYI